MCIEKAGQEGPLGRLSALLSHLPFGALDQFQKFFHIKPLGVPDLKAGDLSIRSQLIDRRFRELQVLTHFFDCHDFGHMGPHHGELFAGDSHFSLNNINAKARIKRILGFFIL